MYWIVYYPYTHYQPSAATFTICKIIIFTEKIKKKTLLPPKHKKELSWSYVQLMRILALPY